MGFFNISFYVYKIEDTKFRNFLQLSTPPFGNKMNVIETLEGFFLGETIFQITVFTGITIKRQSNWPSLSLISATN